jgi:hypothetical protein
MPFKFCADGWPHPQIIFFVLFTFLFWARVHEPNIFSNWAGACLICKFSLSNDFLWWLHVNGL